MGVTGVEAADVLRQRDEFAAFYRHAYPGAKRLAYLLLNGSPDAEDVVQEAFTRLHRRFATVVHPDRYLRAVIVNGTKQRLRTRSRERVRLRLVAGGRRNATDEPEPLLDAVAGLPHRQRVAIVLRYWAGLADDEIAATLGSRPATVRSLVHRGLQQLRKDIPR
jgi:RNA polymerase sigma factor (sigma-70 family)